MSTKKNIFLNNYLETKALLENIIFLEIERIETLVTTEEIKILNETIKLREEEALRLLDISKNTSIEESTITSTTTDLITVESTPILEQIEQSCESLNAPLNENNIELAENTKPTIFIDDLPTEESIQTAYKIKISFLKKKNFRDLFTIYFTNLSKTQAIKLLLRLFGESPITSDLLEYYSSTLSMLIKDSAKLFNFKYNVNSTLEPAFFLFRYYLKFFSMKTAERFFKLKIKRSRLKKKRKLRKLYIIKKLRKITFLRKTKKKFISLFSANIAFKLFNERPISNLLIKKLPISQRVIETTNVEFFYKLNKDFKREILSDSQDYFEDYFEESDDFLIYLRNYNQKPYLKLRKARIAHWHLFFNKTIRKQRYKGFINKFIRKYHKLSYAYTFFVNFFTDFKLSWSRTNKLDSFCKNILIENHNNSILKLPLVLSKILKFKLLKKKNYYARKKVGKWSYLNFRRATCPWLQRKKNSPKLAKHLQPNLFYMNYVSHWDFMTGYVFLEEKLDLHTIPVSNEFKTNFLLKLHMYRYKSNKKCM